MAALILAARFTDSTVPAQAELKNLAMRIELVASSLNNKSMVVSLRSNRESTYEALRRNAEVIANEAAGIFANLHLNVNVVNFFFFFLKQHPITHQ